MLTKHTFDRAELDERIERSYNRLLGDYYQMPDVFQEYCADWPGDKEGRALLAFVSHYKITGRINPCMEELMKALPRYTNEHLYFDPKQDPVIHEQQLSGHSWFLRGLCEHYEQFGDEFSLTALKSVTEHLYLPTAGRYAGYPVNRDPKHLNEGGVSGHSATLLDGWNLSTDVGCAFMSIDGLSHVYKITKDERVKALLDEMIGVYTAIDKVALRAQTHCTLTAARGMLRMYGETGDDRYLNHAKDIYELYTVGGGMDLTYQNLNWWGRPNTWTEPCAIVDSLMVALTLYEITGEDAYRRMATRIYHNGLATAQRPNGGAGTDSVVYLPYDHFPGVTEQYLTGYEAPFCCTMRLAEGLWYISTHTDVLWYETDEDEQGNLIPTRDSHGRYMSGDILLCEPAIDPAVERDSGWKLPKMVTEADGHKLLPLIKYYKTPDAVAVALRQKIVF
ncbi:MAG: hypothetical protein IJA91_06690 [Clostridia bacterium]|nr:hypothetical protein [Clostridia bacterium]